jgi:hypothetical protein
MGGCRSRGRTWRPVLSDVYALGDLTALPMAKAGVFAEAAARVVADDIGARIGG